MKYTSALGQAISIWTSGGRITHSLHASLREEGYSSLDIQSMAQAHTKRTT